MTGDATVPARMDSGRRPTLNSGLIRTANAVALSLVLSRKVAFIAPCVENNAFGPLRSGWRLAVTDSAGFGEAISGHILSAANVRVLLVVARCAPLPEWAEAAAAPR